MTPEPNDTDAQASEMMREMKIKTAVEAMGKAIAIATGSPEDAELIAQGYSEIFAPKMPNPAMLHVPAWMAQPQHMPSFIEQTPEEGEMLWHWPDIARDAIHAHRTPDGSVRLNYRNSVSLFLKGAAAQAYWDWQMEQYELQKAQYESMRRPQQ